LTSDLGAATAQGQTLHGDAGIFNLSPRATGGHARQEQNDHSRWLHAL
jgi:hypothetical protein